MNEWIRWWKHDWKWIQAKWTNYCCCVISLICMNRQRSSWLTGSRTRTGPCLRFCWRPDHHGRLLMAARWSAPPRSTGSWRSKTLPEKPMNIWCLDLQVGFQRLRNRLEFCSADRTGPDRFCRLEEFPPSHKHVGPNIRSRPTRFHPSCGSASVTWKLSVFGPFCWNSVGLGGKNRQQNRAAVERTEPHTLVINIPSEAEWIQDWVLVLVLETMSDPVAFWGSVCVVTFDLLLCLGLVWIGTEPSVRTRREYLTMFDSKWFWRFLLQSVDSENLHHLLQFLLISCVFSSLVLA